VTAGHAGAAGAVRWKSSTIRADLKDVLEDGAGETASRRLSVSMLKNNLGLRERGSWM